MIDYLSHILRTYHHATRYRPDDSYTSLTLDSRCILDFPVPRGLSVTLGKCISPELKASYTVGIPNIRSAGFLFTSLPVAGEVGALWGDNEGDGEGGLLGMDRERERERGTTEVKVVSTVNREEGGNELPANAAAVALDLDARDISTHDKAETETKKYLLYGRIFEDLRLEAMYIRSLSQRTHFVASGVNSWRRAPNGASSISAQLLHAGESYNAGLSWTSDDQVLGVSGLFRFGNTGWAAGSEVCYTAKEKSGGLSFGARYKSLAPSRQPPLSTSPYPPHAVRSALTFLANPIMGHFSTSYTTTVRSGLTMSTRYDINVYSYEADLAVGLEYLRKDRSQMVKARVSLVEGLALKLEGQYRRALLSIGLMTEFARNPRRSIGIELQVS
ncbi:uncharacterized protein EV422DRAFT_568858 [Fimicolochytrium jonesii]|uniref:uncharacterized protein n=1 Tax=Fimicolochytrium jonesii TaxID=1396493 RepID=UPI0022FE4159|nr:uncharacterized protein EV422DRAFT_568858 [Fimicolochytrium jonesii]KAI8819433.1 hypothetical protein EV422DRAFT_568858 [Fimicolochytrium jonesii]